MIAVEDYRAMVDRFHCGDMTIAELVEHLAADPMFAIYVLGPMRRPQGEPE